MNQVKYEINIEKLWRNILIFICIYYWNTKQKKRQVRHPVKMSCNWIVKTIQHRIWSNLHFTFFYISLSENKRNTWLKDFSYKDLKNAKIQYERKVTINIHPKIIPNEATPFWKSGTILNFQSARPFHVVYQKFGYKHYF